MTPSAHVDTFARDNLPPPAQWPVFLPGSPPLPYPARMNATVELLDRQVAGGHADRVALRTDDAQCSYAQLLDRVGRIAHVLREDLGLVPGNRVLLRSANNPMMAASLLAVMKAGLIAVPTMPLLRARELAAIIDKARVDAALCDVRLIDEMRDAWSRTAGADPGTSAGATAGTSAGAAADGPAGRSRAPTSRRQPPRAQRLLAFNHGSADGPAAGSLDARCLDAQAGFEACPVAADDVALIAFTSGTTGQPKGTMHFHRDVVAMCDLFPRSILKCGADDVFCGTPPLAFTFGLGGMLCFPLRVGASVVLTERATPESLLATIERHRATTLFTAPTFYRQMALHAKGHDLSSLRRSVSAGEVLPDAIRSAWRDASGIEMIDGIGSTEMIHIFVSSAPEDFRRGAIGKPVPGYEAMIVDEQMNPLPPGQTGLLAVRGPTGCRYLADERQTRYVREGWNLPGDSFRMDDDGYFHFQARADDMIVSAGYNIAGPEVEEAMLEHPDVAECAVVGLPDEARGQVVTAFVVVKPGVVADDALATRLQDHVKATIAPFKYPRSVRFVPGLPRTETGKLQRFRLKQDAR